MVMKSLSNSGGDSILCVNRAVYIAKPDGLNGSNLYAVNKHSSVIIFFIQRLKLKFKFN